MTQPTTQDQKYTPAMLAAQAETQRRRQQELTQAAVNMAEDHRAAADLQRAHALDLSHRLVEIRNIATVALYDHEGMTVEVLGGALGEILELTRGGK